MCQTPLVEDQPRMTNRGKGNDEEDGNRDQPAKRQAMKGEVRRVTRVVIIPVPTCASM